MGTLGPIIGAVLTVIVDTVVPILTALMDSVGAFLANILATATNIMQAISMLISGSWSVIQGIFETFLGVILAVTTGDLTMLSQGRPSSTGWPASRAECCRASPACSRAPGTTSA